MTFLTPKRLLNYGLHLVFGLLVAFFVWTLAARQYPKFAAFVAIVAMGIAHEIGDGDLILKRLFPYSIGEWNWRALLREGVLDVLMYLPLAFLFFWFVGCGTEPTAPRFGVANAPGVPGRVVLQPYFCIPHSVEPCATPTP